MSSSQTLSPDRIRALEQVESYAKPIGTVIGSATAVGAGVLTLIGLFSDIYKFFLAVVVMTLVCGLGSVLLIIFRFRRSTLASESDVRVPRYGRGIILVSMMILLGFLLLGCSLIIFFHRSIFDPVTTNLNESGITIESASKDRIVVGRALGFIPDKDKTIEVVFLPKNKDKLGPQSYPYILSFDVLKKDRFDWAKIERVTVNVVAYESVPANLEFRAEQMTALMPAIEFKVVVHKNTATKTPAVYDAQLIHTSQPITRRGSVVIDDGKPHSFFVDVHFEQEGVYEIVPEITVNDGWRRKGIRPMKSVTVACVIRDAETIDRMTEEALPPRVRVPRAARLPSQLNSYRDLQNLLNDLIEPDRRFGPHKDFWNTLDYEMFTTGNFPWVRDPYTGNPLPILVRGNSAKSNLILALRGAKGTIFDPENGKIGRMPPGPPLTEDQIKLIADWIDRGCPNPKER